MKRVDKDRIENAYEQATSGAIHPDVIYFHSRGEYYALTAAGCSRLDDDTWTRLDLTEEELRNLFPHANNEENR